METVNLTKEYYLKLGSPRVSQDLPIHVYSNENTLVDAYVNNQGINPDEVRIFFDWIGLEKSGSLIYTSSNERIYIYVQETPFNQKIYQDLTRWIVEHNMNMIIPLEYSCVNKEPENGPYWIRQGIEEFFILRALTLNDSHIYSQERNNLSLRASQEIGLLKDAVTSSGFYRSNLSGATATMAVELLASTNGEKALVDFYNNIWLGTPWRDSFEIVFKTTIDEFYEIFTEHRDKGYPETDIAELRHNNTQQASIDQSRDSGLEELWIESETGNLRIDYAWMPTQMEARRDLAQAQCAVDFLADLFGHYPDEPIVLKLSLDDSRGGTKRAIFDPPITVPFQFDSDSLLAHEIGHVFTEYLLPTDLFWFNEGISIFAEDTYLGMLNGIINSIAESKFSDLKSSSRSADAVEAYSRLWTLDNIFIDNRYNEIQVRHSEPIWINSHHTGMLFFIGLEAYGIHGFKIREFLQALNRLSQVEGRIDIDHLISSAKKISGKDITSLLDLLEPGIRFNAYLNYSTQEKIDRFFADHPEYTTPRVSWID